MRPRFLILVAALTKEQHAAWQKMRDETRDQLAKRRQRRQR